MQQVFQSHHRSMAMFTKPLFCCETWWHVQMHTPRIVCLCHIWHILTASDRVELHTMWEPVTEPGLCEKSRRHSIITWQCSLSLYFCIGSCWYSIILHDMSRQTYHRHIPLWRTSHNARCYLYNLIFCWFSLKVFLHWLKLEPRLLNMCYLNIIIASTKDILVMIITSRNNKTIYIDGILQSPETHGLGITKPSLPL